MEKSEQIFDWYSAISSEMAMLFEQLKLGDINAYIKYSQLVYKIKAEQGKEEWERIVSLIYENKFKYHYTICAIARDENPYLIEWIKWHLDIGFERIFLYDNFSKEPIQEFLDANCPFEYRSKVEVSNWGSTNYPQKDAYNDCCSKHKEDVEWILYIDIDEFFHSVKSLPILMAEYANCGAVYFAWKMYNANGLKHYDSKPVQERFTRECKSLDKWSGKTISRPCCVEFVRVHDALLKEGFRFVDTAFDNKMDVGRFCLPDEKKYYDVAWVNHYYTKSYDEWCEKILRGTVDKDCSRKYQEFFDYNPDMMGYFDSNFISSQNYNQ